MFCMKLKCMIHCLLAMEFLLFLPTLNPPHFMAQGRRLSTLSNLTVKINEEKVMKMRAVIGSRPPRCDNLTKCKSCGNCEAVQVPISKEFIFQNQFNFHTPKINVIAYSRGDDIANYKPMCWKCKCGDLYINP